jgi:hypothetical protein
MHRLVHGEHKNSALLRQLQTDLAQQQQSLSAVVEGGAGVSFVTLGVGMFLALVERRLVNFALGFAHSVVMFVKQAPVMDGDGRDPCVAAADERASRRVEEGRHVAEEIVKRVERVRVPHRYNMAWRLWGETCLANLYES